MASAHRRRVKVVRIIARLNVGGPARHVVLLNEALTRQGYDTLLVHGSIGPDESSFEELAAERGLRTHRIVSLGRRVRPTGDIVAFGALVRLLFVEAPDVVHTHTAKAGALGRLAATLYNLTRARARRCVIVHTFHGHVLTGYFTNTSSRLVRLAERMLATLSDCIIAISSSQHRDLVSFKVASSEQTVTIPLGLDLAQFLTERSREAARRALGLDPHGLVIGYVGRFVPIKDLDTLMRAFAVVAEQMPEAVFLLAGGGPTRPELEKLADSLNVRKRVCFLGWASDLPPLYAAMDVCCLSSLNEGTPVALIEAMAAKTPVVATSVGGVQDLVDDGCTGMLVPPRDINALAQAILRLASDPQRRRLMGEAARESVVQKFSVGRLARDIHSTYQAELRKKRAGRAAPAS